MASSASGEPMSASAIIQETFVTGMKPLKKSLTQMTM
jgi:hypothetical protein